MSYLWTKEKIRKVLELWDTKTTQELADDLGTTKMSISFIAAVLRKEGAPLTRKTSSGHIRKLAREVLDEKGIPPPPVV